MNVLRTIGGVVLASLLASGTGWSQAVAGSQISGIVRDTSGAPIPGAEVTVTPSGRAARRMVPEKEVPPGLTYATVEKRRRRGRVVEILVHLIFGTIAALARALRLSRSSRRVNVSFLE